MNNKIKVIVSLSFLIFISVSVSALNISVNSLGHENYGIELCTHNGTCVYYNQNESLQLENTADYIIKIVNIRKEHKYGQSLISDFFNEYEFWIMLLLIIVVIIGFYKAVGLIMMR